MPAGPGTRQVTKNTKMSGIFEVRDCENKHEFLRMRCESAVKSLSKAIKTDLRRGDEGFMEWLDTFVDKLRELVSLVDPSYETLRACVDDMRKLGGPNTVVHDHSYAGISEALYKCVSEEPISRVLHRLKCTICSELSL